MDTVGLHTNQTNKLIIEQSLQKLKIINKKTKLLMMNEISMEKIIHFLEEFGRGNFVNKTIEYNFQNEIYLNLHFEIQTGHLVCCLEISSSFGFAIENVMANDASYKCNVQLQLAKLKEPEKKQTYNIVTNLLYYSEDLLIKMGGVKQKVRADQNGKITFDFQSQNLDFSMAVPPLPPDLSVPPPPMNDRPGGQQPSGSTVRRDLFSGARLPLRSARNDDQRCQNSSSGTSRDEMNITSICNDLQNLQSEYWESRNHRINLPAMYQREQRSGKNRGTGAKHKPSFREARQHNDYESIDDSTEESHKGRRKTNPKTSTPRQESKNVNTKQQSTLTNEQENNWYPIVENEQQLHQSDPDFVPQLIVRTFFSSLAEAREGKSNHLTVPEVTRIAHNVGLFQLPDNSSLNGSEMGRLVEPPKLDTSTESEDGEITFKEADKNNQDEY